MSPARDALRETFAELDALRRGESRAAMATLVAAQGTTPRKEGAKMWVGAEGRVLGAMTIGGCVDARVLEASEAVLAKGAPTLLTFDLSDGDAWEIGLTCGGTVDVRIEPVQLAESSDPVMRAYDAARAEREAGRRAVIVTPLAGPVARIVVREDETGAGTLGDAARDAWARSTAAEVIRAGVSRVSSCEGDSFFFELHAPPTTMIIFGAGHVAMPLCALARPLGWDTVLVDARERYATAERFPDAAVIRVGNVEEIAREYTYDRSTLVVLTAHDYKFEVPVLRHVLRKEPGYIGLLGSRRRGKGVLDFLAAEGFTPTELARVHVPVGLDLGAETAAEIALATAAEALAVRNGRSGGSLVARA